MSDDFSGGMGFNDIQSPYCVPSKNVMSSLNAQ